MRIVEKTIRIELLHPIELSVEERNLIRRAVQARRRAQTPYFHYSVGAAILSESGRIYIGCNVENANATGTTHAEQNAITSMVTNEGPVKISAMAIVGAPKGAKVKNIDDLGFKPSHPTVEVKDFCFACGHCLQIVWENCLADPDVPLLRLTKWGEVARTTIGDAFSMPFGPESLGVNIKS